MLRERRPGERRVALVPELVPKLTEAGFEVAVEPGAGVHLHATDDAYREAGAYVGDDAADDAKVVLSVQPPDLAHTRHLPEGTVTVSFLPTIQELPLVRILRDRKVTAFSMDLIPRTSRAQSMDALSSQALVAGYRCAIVAAERLPRFFPLFMTAAGTVRPASVLVLGAGVAGLQAIATARRLGAMVEAYDVREASAEEIRSLGAKFVELPLEALGGTGGYAREMTEERAARQRELLTPYVANADALITTAAVPGRPAPLLVTANMVKGMKPGSVVVDLAAEQGSNVEGSKPGEELTVNGITIWGGRNVPSQMPLPASRLYAQNVVNFLLLMLKEGNVAIDFDDDVVAGSCVTHAGEVRHHLTQDQLGEVG